MKNACRNFVSLDKLRRRPTKKNITSLLILPVIAAALFATPTAAFARSNARDSNQLRTASPVLPPSNSASNPTTPTTPSLASIHMLDKIHGWALTQGAILNTVDGGLHWQDVTPANGFSNNASPMSTPQGDFLNDQDAWVVTPAPSPPLGKLNTIRVLRTTDGGKSWQSTNIQTPAGSAGDTPHFLNPLDGWLQTFGEPGSGVSAIFHTTDGGLHWNEPGKLNPKDISDPSGSSFSDDQNGWEAGDNPAAAMTAADKSGPYDPQPLLEVTHDGSKTWQSQSLPALPEGDKSDMLSTRPPVFFGNTGLLPVEDQITPPRKPGIGLDLYVTHNGGQTWTPTPLVTSNGPDSFTVDVADSQHAWATLGANLYITSTGGQGWTLLPQPPQLIDNLDFIDANNGWAMSSGGATAGNTKNQSPSPLQTTNGGHTWQPINYSVAWKSTTLSALSQKPTNPTPVGGSTVTSPIGKGSTSPTPSSSPWKNCGNFFYNEGAKAANTALTLTGWTNDSAQQNVTCFLQAFQQCVPASIGFVVDSIDSKGQTTTENDFSTKPQSGNCAISKSVNVNMELQPKEAETCARVEQTATSLSFVGCGRSGTITFPLVAPKPN